MRIIIKNESDRPDEIVIPLAEFAARFFPHRAGVVPVTFKSARNGRPHGICYGKRRCVIWIERLEDTRGYPRQYDRMHYFRHANHEDVKSLWVNDWKEYCLNIIAHELEHTTDGNKRMRRSRQEIHAWNRGVEVVEASRRPEALEFFRQRGGEILASELKKIEKAEFKKSPEYKRQRCEALFALWQRKAKLAQTKLKKLKARINYFEKRERAAANKGK